MGLEIVRFENYLEGWLNEEPITEFARSTHV
jgi:hypothetical protein